MCCCSERKKLGGIVLFFIYLFVKILKNARVYKKKWVCHGQRQKNNLLLPCPPPKVFFSKVTLVMFEHNLAISVTKSHIGHVWTQFCHMSENRAENKNKNFGGENREKKLGAGSTVKKLFCLMWLFVTDMSELGSDMANVTVCHRYGRIGFGHGQCDFCHRNVRIGFGHGQCDFWSPKWVNRVRTWPEMAEFGSDMANMTFCHQNSRIVFGHGQCDPRPPQRPNWAQT